jgi:hypothetical protein
MTITICQIAKQPFSQLSKMVWNYLISGPVGSNNKEPKRPILAVSYSLRANR